MQCKFNDAALEDIGRITEYGYELFGEKAARQYAEALKQKCHAIADAPLQHQAVDELRSGYRRGVYKAHAIYFPITDDSVEIMRILHSEDPKKTTLENELRQCGEWETSQDVYPALRPDRKALGAGSWSFTEG